MEIGAGGGIQPAKARCFDRASLPTQGHRSSRFVEAWAGIEPAYADLQSAASPLCHQAARGTAGAILMLRQNGQAERSERPLTLSPRAAYKHRYM